MFRRSFASFAVAALLLLTASFVFGCNRMAGSEQVAEADSERTASEQLIPINGNGSGELQGVSVVPVGDIGWSPGEPAARAYKKYGNVVDVRVFDSIRGVETHLTVPMWYDEHTTYGVKVDPKRYPLTDAVEDGSVVWWGGPGADIEYHFEDGYFVLDSLLTAQTRGPRKQ